MTDSPRPKPRWHYRFGSYGRALALLREGVSQADAAGLSDLEKEGLVQRFEYTWELAWKLLKDYLEAEVVVLETITPRATVRAAFSAQLIGHGDLWMAALDARNAMAHTYDARRFDKVIGELRGVYLGLFEALYERLAPLTKEDAPDA